MLSGFSWELGYHHYRIVPQDAPYCLLSSSRRDLPPLDITTGFNVLFRQYADVSLLRRHVALPSGTGMFTGWPSTVPCGCVLGPDLP